MNIVLWVLAVVLAVAFAAAGGMKLSQSVDQLRDKGMGYVDDFSPGTVKAIGALEVLAAIGLVVPPLVDVATVLVPLAALGLVLMMVGAVITHVRRHEIPGMAPSVVLGILAAVVAWGRFGPYAFGS